MKYWHPFTLIWYLKNFWNPLNHGFLQTHETREGGGALYAHLPPTNPYQKWYQTLPLYTYSLPLLVFDFFQFWRCLKKK